MASPHSSAPLLTGPIPLFPTRSDLEENITRALALLEDIEQRYEWQRSAIETALHPQVWKDWKLNQLDHWRQAQRGPTVQILTALYQRCVFAELTNSRSLNAIRSGQ